jgi:charged multivesicular body protein 7
MTLLDLLKANPLFTQRRKVSLYANFSRLKETNIHGYEANITAWKSLLLTAVDGGLFEDNLAIPANEALLESLHDPEFGRPLALNAVLEELVETKTVIPLQIFRSQTHSIYESSINIGSVFSWVLAKTGLWESSWRAEGPAGSGSLKREKYICINRLETIADAVWTKLEILGATSSYCRSVFTREMFYKTISLVTVVPSGTVTLSETDLECVMIFLVRDRKRMASSGNVVKLITGVLSEVTQKDVAVANLQATVDQVSRRTDSLSDRITVCTEKARQALRNGHKPVAKYALRSRKVAESSLAKALSMLENLEQVLEKIDDASDQVEVVSALEAGADILGSLNATLGGVEKVGDLLDKLREQADETDEIAQEISSLTGAVDEDAIEDELERLDKEARLAKLPPAPDKVEADQAVEELTEKMEQAHIREPITE